jgi:hypothetical protein
VEAEVALDNPDHSSEYHSPQVEAEVALDTHYALTIHSLYTHYTLTIHSHYKVCGGQGRGSACLLKLV